MKQSAFRVVKISKCQTNSRKYVAKLFYFPAPQCTVFSLIVKWHYEQNMQATLFFMLAIKLLGFCELNLLRVIALNLLSIF